MDTASPVPLVARLSAVARLWVDRHEATLARLGREVVNDGGFFTRLESPGASTTTATLTRFARFLADPVNWPEGAVPDEVGAFAHAVGVSAPGAGASTGSAGDMSGAGSRSAAA